MTVLPPGSEELIARAFSEDIGDGDHTSLSTIPADAKGAARLLVKADGVLAGVEMAQAVTAYFDPAITLRIYLEDGAAVKEGDIAFNLMGPTRSILQVERILLNFMQRMSGIATLTHRFVDAVEGTGCRVLDTRKTTPGLRAIEKWAVRLGGGHNHRMGLYDMIMIKDNHHDFAGGIPKAIQAARAYLASTGKDLPIEVETRDLDEVEQVLATGGVQRIMLDNFTPKLMRQAVERIDRRYETEASGGITLATARSFAETGVDFISVGALTHSVPSLDLSLKAL
ncbi:MAG: carboxylating nicotinate-nucleotide diphosphorylase [Flavobacteriales bacterium]|nr:carboxylating nicotinate-nucleotide diphosphorylase [Flavobacteriales bacterium]MBK7114205.1 carboxylating nicotinate-nucleotide diphosphorylase [Flavobacteriales bacterium]MBK7620108.1 carboxylating nicotinate-nucleotide diphosphorylase [Flavobacteriales bacterium]MBK8531757.1 carboxylating nicotinate-nucleotide diphosphorylase [Flavobacteriales bacterium]MBK8708059.1 carboxylating nicotinate-nucleotide diphosphorylase [Flavobacteriales bacterium]